MPASASADADLLRLLRHAAAFDRLVAIQLRWMALLEPHLAERLRHTANQLDADAAEMEKRIS